MTKTPNTVCGAFQGYGAIKSGDNIAQTSITPMRPDTNVNTVVKSVMTQYAPGVSSGVKTATQRVIYTVSSDRGNGITVRRKEDCLATPAPGKA